MINTGSLLAGAHTIVETTEISSSNDTNVISTTKQFIISLKPDGLYAFHSRPHTCKCKIYSRSQETGNQQEMCVDWYSRVTNISKL